MKIKNKKGMGPGEIVILTIAILFFITIVIVFLSKNGVINEWINNLRESITNIPEEDATELQNAIRANDEAQRSLAGGFQTSLEKAAKCPNNFCLEELPSIDREGFYEEGQRSGTYNLYIEKDGADMKIRLTKYAVLDTDDNSEAVLTPVSVTIIKNAQPCIIEGNSAQQFYEKFNDIDAAPASTDISGINPTPVNSFVLSSTSEHVTGRGSEYEREIGINTNGEEDCAVNPESDECRWELFFGKRNQSTIYVMKIKQGTTDYLCFFPLYSDGILGFEAGCGEPENSMMDIDCFDTENEHTIKQNFIKKILPESYTCSSTQSSQTP
ncbi:MAG: hypothetical protein ACP5N3_01260 [Candidatus Nanoarchaeia archaeon]